MFRKIKIDNGLLIISSVYILTFLIMLPLRNQTYQDDWAYMLSVKNFLNTGILKVSDWSSASLIFQIYWGSIFSKIFGASLATLNLSTITLLYVGLVSFYYLLKNLGLNQIRSTFFTIILMSFPWVFDFSYTFLTDVPFMSLSLITIFFYTKAIQKNKMIFYLLGSAIAGCSYLTRQLGIAFPISIFIVLLYTDITKRRTNIKKYICALLPFIVMAIIYSLWLKTDDNLTFIQSQVSTIFFRDVLPYLSPINVKTVGTAFGYYLNFVQRTLLFFHLIIGFLLPVFLVFKPNLISIKNIFKKHKVSIIVISIFYLIFLSLEIFIHYSRPTFLLEIPSLITRFNIFPIFDFTKSWKYFVSISVVIWIPIIAIIFQKSVNSIFEPIKKGRRKLFTRLSILIIIALLFYEFLLFQDIFKSGLPPHVYTDPITAFLFYLGKINTAVGHEIMINSLVIIIAIATALFSINALVSFFKIKPNIKKPELAFMIFSFLIIFLILTIYMYFYWHQYIISIVPFFVIGLALISKKWKVNKFRMFAVCTFLLLFSVTVTKNRYEVAGIKWEMYDKLVQTGIEPKNMGGEDESWIPWWYFESSLKEAVVKKFDGSKYNIPRGQWGVWQNIKPDSNCRYDLIEVPLNYKIGDKEKSEILLNIRTNYTILTQKRFIAKVSMCK